MKHFLFLVALLVFSCKFQKEKEDNSLSQKEVMFYKIRHKKIIDNFIQQHPLEDSKFYAIGYSGNKDSLYISLVQHQHDLHFTPRHYKGFFKYKQQYPFVILSTLSDSLNGKIYNHNLLKNPVPEKFWYSNYRTYIKKSPHWQYHINSKSAKLLSKDSLWVWHIGNIDSVFWRIKH